MARKTKRPPAPEPVEVSVRSLTNFAFNAGLTIESMEALILAAPDEECRIRECVCISEDCGGDTTRHLIVAAGLEANGLNRDLIYCEACGLADIWV
jgi:hypothetical protein